ncbi:hypothetical protein RRG08_033285 [Elysia crispata]|uniref:Uncharacterized protein n=1 Tax=Elysia crispata TaxID=231223 RepID=A0AAE0XS22_9GAST|nr:hypothetical protein RRG08_033285 [Elysia crispata]
MWKLIEWALVPTTRNWLLVFVGSSVRQTLVKGRSLNENVGLALESRYVEHKLITVQISGFRYSRFDSSQDSDDRA